MENQLIKVLLIEDDYEDAKLVKLILNGENTQKFKFAHVDHVEKGLEYLKHNNCDVILLDLFLPDSAGEETIHNVLQSIVNLPIIILTSMNDLELAIKAIHEGAQDYIIKDELESNLLLRSIRYALERKSIQEKLKLEKERIQKYLDVAGVIILVIEKDFVVSSINKTGCTILEYNEEDIVGKNWIENFIPKVWQEKETKRLTNLFSKNNSSIIKNDCPVLTSLGKEKFISWSYVLLKSEHEEIKQLLCSGEDITDRKLVEEQVVSARNKAEFLNDLFIKDFSNMFRNIEWSTEILAQEQIDRNDKIDALEMLRNNIKQTWSLLEKVRRFSDLDTHDFGPNKIDVYKTIMQVVDSIKKEFPHKILDLAINFTENQIFVKADEFLWDIFSNVLQNSMKFDNKNKVSIEINVESNDDQYLKIKIIDQGRGISDCKKDIIFTRMVYRQKRLPGFGIGLSLVAQIIDRYGGKIWVEDRIKGDSKQGAVVSIILPKSL